MTNSIHRESSSIRLPWKIVLLGDAGVGKSSLVKRFLTEKYTDMYTPTVEDNYIHNIELPGIDLNYLDKYFS
jgi:GTPase SAR1 family protein